MTTPSISCIIPVFNGERYLSEALDSVFAQTLRPAKIIIVDDGSTDGTVDLISALPDEIEKIHQKNQGPAAARNAGLLRAATEFVAFLDADDLWHEEKCQRQLARFEARPELDLCAAHSQNFWEPELKAEALALQQSPAAEPQVGASGTALVRRSLFDRVGCFDAENTHRDYHDWLIRVREQGAAVEIMSDVLLYRRMHHDNLSRDRTTTDHENMFRALKASLERRRQTDE